ncbi:MAG: hypothetical protein WC755_09735, partial [Candidatus Woesearchaeota archaeon]
RLNNLVQKLEQATTEEEKMLIKDQLNARIGYIEEKNANGLINYGNKNALSANYELFKKLSSAQAYVSLIDYLNENKINTTAERRENLLAKIMENNDSMFSKEQAKFKNQETARGAMVAAGFSLLGSQIRGLLHGTDAVHTNELEGINKYNHEHILNDHQTNTSDVHTGHENTATGNTHNIPEQNIFKPVKVEISSNGAIQTIADLKKQISENYNGDFSKAPSSIQDFMKTDNTQEAIKLGFYNPNSPEESAMSLKGSTLGFDEKGNLISHDIKTGQDTILNETTKYNGPMSDTDHVKAKIQHVFKKQENPLTGKSMEEEANSLNTENNRHNINPITGKTLEEEMNTLQTTGNDHEIEHTVKIDNTSVNENIIDQNKTPIVDQNNNPVKVEQNETNITDTHKVETENTLNIKEQEVKNIETYLRNNNDYLLSDQQLEEVSKIYTHNIDKMFPVGHEQTWNNIKDSHTGDMTAEKLIYRPLDVTKKEYHPLITHLQTLSEKTKLEPYGATLLSPVPETLKEFELRCLQKATEMGILNEVTLQ